MTPTGPAAPGMVTPDPPEPAERPDAASRPLRRPAVLVGCIFAAVAAVAAGLWVTVGTSDGAADRAGAVDAVGAASAEVSTTTTTTTTTTAAQPVPPAVAAPPTQPPEEVLPVSGWGRRVVYSISGQRMWWVDHDESVLRTSRVSGRLDMPDTGVFQVYSKTLNATGLDGSRMDRFVRFAKGPNGWAIGFHDIPEFDGVPVQTLEQLGEPLSHGCIRQSDEDAMLTWDFLQVGDNVVVVA